MRSSARIARKRGGARRPKIQIGGRGSRVLTVARILLVIRDRVSILEREREKLEAGHTCGNYWCVNVRHLIWQTRSENESMKAEHRAYAEFADDVEAISTADAEAADA